MLKQFHPFKQNNTQQKSDGKERVRDPLDVRSLLTDNTRKAVITPDGELKIKDEQGGTNGQGVELMKERYWGSEANSYQALLDKQLAVETRAMKASFPGFELRRAQEPFRQQGWQVAAQDSLFWTGVVKTHSARSYLVAVVYPKDYPFGEIRAYVLEPYIPATEHRFKDGHLCLYDHDGKGGRFESAKSTAVTVIAWTAAWLHAYEIWQQNGKWPSVEEKNP
jgi:hypothetical protein